jgi:hypothetical protein
MDKNSAIPISKQGIVGSASGQLKPRFMTRGWFLLLVQWQDGSTGWEEKKDLKATIWPNPGKVAENLHSSGGSNTLLS